MGKAVVYFIAIVFLVLTCNQCSISSNGKTDVFNKLGENVYVFSDDMDMAVIQHLIDSVYRIQHQRESEFNENRIAFLFTPGYYKLNVKVGYYTQVLGLGNLPDDVVIEGGVVSESMPGFKGSVLINFWRSVENLAIIPTVDSTNIWAVSQAAPMRRVHVKGNLQLHNKGAASGGFLADSKIDGNVYFGPQQQWFSRNCDWNNCAGGLWNIVSLGVKGAPVDNWPDRPYLSVDKTPLIREKPYFIFDKKEGLVLAKPLLKEQTLGISWNNEPDDERVAISSFYIANPQKDNSESINAALAQGKNLLFTPGIYKLHKSIQVTNPGTIVVGIGLPSLISENGNPVLTIADVDDVTLSGLVVDAGLVKSEVLVQIGDTISEICHKTQPTCIYDLFVRVGGYHTGKTQKCVVINSNHVIVDHIWLWRADHGTGAGWDLNKSANGLIINGNDVTIYGLFNEHFQEYQTIWNGDNGRIYFYQSEMPYYVPDPEAWKHNETYGYASLKVADSVNDFNAWGVGIYNVFFKSGAQVDFAVEAPEYLENRFKHIVTIWLGGNEDSQVKSIINGKGSAINDSNRKATW